jgi:hypothetical protein
MCAGSRVSTLNVVVQPHWHQVAATEREIAMR